MRPVLLLDIGAGPLPATTPPASIGASWVPAVYVPPPVPVPGGFSLSPITDAVLVTWTAVTGTAPTYVIERAPDVAGAPGAWSVIATTQDLRYTASVSNGAVYWWRMKAVVFGRQSAYTAAVALAARIKNRAFQQEAQPVAENVGDEWYQPSTRITRLWNGASWIVTSALNPARGSGRELIANATFTSRVLGNQWAAGTGALIVDGWSVIDPTPGAWAYLLGGVPTFRLTDGYTLPNNTQVVGYLRSDPFAVGALMSLRALTSIEGAWLTNNFPGGFILLTRTIVDFLDANGGVIGSAEYDVNRTAGLKSSASVMTTPAGTVSARVTLANYCVNLSGAAFTFGTLMWDASIRAVSLVIRNELEVAGSGARIGDQRNLPQSNTTAYGSVRSTTVLSATSAGAVSVNAHSVRYGGTSVAYSAVANAITGLTPNVKYVIYCFDDAYAGGIRTWLAGTNPDAVMQLGDGVVVAGEITIPTSGSSSGGGGGGGGGDWCVDADMVLPDGRRAGDIQTSEAIACWNDDSSQPGLVHLLVESNTLVPFQPCLTLVTDSGAEVTASESTPMTLRDGRTVALPEMLGEDALVRHFDGTLVWEPVTALRDAGLRTVAKIKVHQRCYFAGAVASATVATHNPIQKP